MGIFRDPKKEQEYKGTHNGVKKAKQADWKPAPNQKIPKQLVARQKFFDSGHDRKGKTFHTRPGSMKRHHGRT